MARVEMLKGKIASSGIKYKAIADTLGISKKTLYNKMHGKSGFTVKEAQQLTELLRLTAEESIQIFFGTSVN